MTRKRGLLLVGLPMPESSGGSAFARIATVALLSLGFWALARYGTYMPPVLTADALASRFSASRAEGVLARVLGPERPHPTSTAENAAVRDRIVREYATLGVPTKTYRAFACYLTKRFGELACATVTDILAQVRPGNGKAIVMLSHYDSVPAGPGAADDEAGTASVIEASRALKAIRDPGVHPVLAVNTDGEEFGLLGAAAFLDNPQMKSLVGAVVNVEARGNRGPSLLFQTSPGDGPYINLYADSVRSYEASSLLPVIYKSLPNDTDLTLFIRDGFPAWNFAFSDRVAHYHTALDRRENLDPQSLQMQGENLLGVTNSLSHTDFAALKGRDDIYLSVLGAWLPRLPASWAFPLSALVLVLVLLAISRAPPRSATFRPWLSALSIFPLTVATAGVAGWALHNVAAAVSGYPDPSYAHPGYLRSAFGLAVLGAAILWSRLGDVRTSTLSNWLWVAALALLASIFVFGASPYFLFPALVAAPVLAVLSVWDRDWRASGTLLVIVLIALPALTIWISLAAMGEGISGLSLHPTFTIPAAIAVTAVSPVLSGAMERRVWAICSGVVFAAAIGVAVLAGLQPAYSALAPQRLSIAYVQDATARRAIWAIDSAAPLPSAMNGSAKFSKRTEAAYPYASRKSYVAPAGAPQFPYPTAQVTVGSPSSFGVRHVDVAVDASELTNQVLLFVPKEANLRAVVVAGKRFDVPKRWGDSMYNLIGCFSTDCAKQKIGLDFSTAAPVELYLTEVRYGLPPSGKALVAARPVWATPSQNGDTTVLVTGISIPGVASKTRPAG